MKDGRKNKTFRDAASLRMKEKFASMTPEEKAAYVAKLQDARRAAHEERRKQAALLTPATPTLTPTPAVPPEFFPAADAMAALDLLTEATSAVLGVKLTQQQAAEFWANRLR